MGLLCRTLAPNLIQILDAGFELYYPYNIFAELLLVLFINCMHRTICKTWRGKYIAAIVWRTGMSYCPSTQVQVN